MTPSEQRFWSRVQRTESCWLWKGPCDKKGYGSTSVNGTHVRAHRYAYEQLVGLIPNGLELDHECRNHPCVNPAHLEPVTDRENWLRGESPSARSYKSGLCVSGRHLMLPDNVRKVGRGRTCIACWNERIRKRWKTDPKFRETMRKHNRDNKRRRYQTDPVYRERVKARVRARRSAVRVQESHP